MKIVWNNNVNKVPFYEIQGGDVFRYNNILFMKITSMSSFAVRLDNGKCAQFTDEYVEPVKGKFVMD